MNAAQKGFHQADDDGRFQSATSQASCDRAPQQRFVCIDSVSKSVDVQIGSLGARQTTVLIVGESGAGKERVAREIHDRSGRADGPFVAVDCSSFSETLIESQLFGHVRGAFTGAERDKVGYIRASHTGTLFLDEVGDMPLSLQTRLLRVLQERRVTPVGQTESVPVDVRIIAATHQDLPWLVRVGTFREDLFYRLSAFRLAVPPLRERRNDIIPLAEYFLDLQAAIYEEPRRRLSPSACQWLQAQWWRGNVRELANAIEHALVTSDGGVLVPEDFPEPLLPEGKGPADLAGHALAFDAPSLDGAVMTLAETEWRSVVAALQATGGDKTRAARLLAISRSRLYSILARHDRSAGSSANRSAS